jgi:hypothetical protein
LTPSARQISSRENEGKPMIRPNFLSSCFAGVLAFAAIASFVDADEPTVVRSAKSGAWSSSDTWDKARVPQAGDVVLVKSGHEVAYDVASEEVIRAVHISGVLNFATDRDTRLEVGLVKVQPGDGVSENGFDCDAHGLHAMGKGPQPQLLIGTPEQPIEAGHRALIRLHAIPGTDEKSWPAIVCCGGRMEIHGAPLNRTWVKLTRNADEGATKVFLADAVTGWNEGDQVLITGTSRQEPVQGIRTAHVTDQPASEVRTIVGSQKTNGRASMTAGALATLQLDRPLDKTHRGGEYSAEVANLSRNVIIESADPEKGRGHTMYHRGSAGSISYAEFRHLGKEGVLGRYPIHFHLAGDTMRGSSVVGVSVWDSGNRWITIHGTQYLVVRDCIGYRSVGHGFFLEDGTEVFNVFDRNLAAQATVGKPLPDQVLPFDLNDGAGFWWANSLNAFTRNVAVECDQHGYRFEAEKTETFDTTLPIPQADGSRKPTDIRTLPFLRFEDNEAHCHRRFALNLGGIRGLTYGGFESEADEYKYAQGIGGTCDGVGPDPSHPFVIRNFKVWDTHWAFHAMTPSVMVQGLDVFDCNYGLWRSIMDLHQYDDISFRQIQAHAIFFPMGGHGPTIRMEDGMAKYPNFSRKDDQPPVTIVTGVKHLPSGALKVFGTSVDDERVAGVLVAGEQAESVRGDFAEWEIELPAEIAATADLTAAAIDDAGNMEPRPHVFGSRSDVELTSAVSAHAEHAHP